MQNVIIPIKRISGKPQAVKFPSDGQARKVIARGDGLGLVMRTGGAKTLTACNAVAIKPGTEFDASKLGGSMGFSPDGWEVFFSCLGDV